MACSASCAEPDAHQQAQRRWRRRTPSRSRSSRSQNVPIDFLVPLAGSSARLLLLQAHQRPASTQRATNPPLACSSCVYYTSAGRGSAIRRVGAPPLARGHATQPRCGFGRSCELMGSIMGGMLQQGAAARPRLLSCPPPPTAALIPAAADCCCSPRCSIPSQASMAAPQAFVGVDRVMLGWRGRLTVDNSLVTLGANHATAEAAAHVRDR